MVYKRLKIGQYISFNERNTITGYGAFKMSNNGSESVPRKAKKPCMKSGCSKLVQSPNKYCEEHKIIDDTSKQNRNKYYDKTIRNGRDKQYTVFYKSTEWDKARLQALVRDKYLCQHCLKEKRLTLADMVHHKISIKENFAKRLELSNLVSLCNVCHNKIH